MSPTMDRQLAWPPRYQAAPGRLAAITPLCPSGAPVASTFVTRLATTQPAVEPDDIAAAMDRIRSHVRETPMIEIAAGELGFNHPVTLKLELMQHAGSFKTRGAFNRVLIASEAGDIGPAGLIA